MIIADHDREPRAVGLEQAQDPPAVALAGRVHQLRLLLLGAAELAHRVPASGRAVHRSHSVSTAAHYPSMMTRRESCRLWIQND